MRREDVDDVPAHGDLPRLLDEGHALVTDRDEPCDERVAVEGFADRDAHGRGGEQRSRGDAKREGRGGCDDDRRSLVRGIARARGFARAGAGGAVAATPVEACPVEAMQHLHALRDDEGLGREAIEGQRVVAREAIESATRPRVPRADPASASLAASAARESGRHVEDGAVAVGADQVARGDTLRGAAQAGDPQQGSPLAQHRAARGRRAYPRAAARGVVGLRRLRPLPRSSRSHPALIPLSSFAHRAPTAKARIPSRWGSERAAV